MKVCPKCQNKYPDDANFCPREECASDEGPSRLEPIVEAPPARFVPVSRIGGGPSGEVWQANDAQSGGAVAYKLVAPAVLPSASSQERLQRELRQLQRVANPRVPKVIDFGQSPEGRFFIATELVGGEPLDQVVAQHGPLALDRAKRVIAQVGEALLEAQKVGIVHRDLAAKNVLVSGDDTVRVINFTVPRPLNDSVFGVPEFMSPEQAEGKLIDQRSNTYSLGALLYFALTGQAPASGATPEAVLQAVQKSEITPPSILHGAGLTAEVDRVVMKALEKSSTRRPLTMRQFLADVAALVVTDEQRLAPPGPGKEPAFARTMMFAGGASEVQKLVAQALAARAAGEAPQNGAHEGTNVGMGPPAAAAPVEAPAPASQAAVSEPAPAASTTAPESGPSSAATEGSGRTPSPVSRPSHGAAVAKTMIAMPAAGTPLPGAIPGASPPAGTPPGGGTPAPQPSTGTNPGTGAAANFRETLWFKKGDVDQMVADAKDKIAAALAAKAQSAAPAPEEHAPAEDAKPLEDRYVDDGTVTAEDRQKFSLGSGPVGAQKSGRHRSVPGERMSDAEVLDEIGGGKRLIIIGIVAAVVVALVAVAFISMRGKNRAAEEAARAAAAAKADEEAAAQAKQEEEEAAAKAKAAREAEEKAAAAKTEAAEGEEGGEPSAKAATKKEAGKKEAETKAAKAAAAETGKTKAAKKKATKKKAATAKKHR